MLSGGDHAVSNSAVKPSNSSFHLSSSISTDCETSHFVSQFAFRQLYHLSSVIPDLGNCGGYGDSLSTGNSPSLFGVVFQSGSGMI